MEPGGLSHRSHPRGGLWEVSLCSVLGLPSAPSSLLWLHKTVISLLTGPGIRVLLSGSQPPSCSLLPVHQILSLGCFVPVLLPRVETTVLH